MAETFIKRLELAVRRFYNGRVGRSGQPMLVSEAKDVIGYSSLRRVLLLRQDRIGDVLVSTPVIRELRRLLPQAAAARRDPRRDHGGGHFRLQDFPARAVGCHR